MLYIQCKYTYFTEPLYAQTSNSFPHTSDVNICKNMPHIPKVFLKYAVKHDVHV